MVEALQKSGLSYGMYSIHMGMISRSRMDLATYMTRQLRSGESSRLEGTGIHLKDYSSKWPKMFGSKIRSNSEFARKGCTERKVTSMLHGVRNEEEYEAAPKKVQDEINRKCRAMTMERKRRMRQ
jgi:hypothetical protein